MGALSSRQRTSHDGVSKAFLLRRLFTMNTDIPTSIASLKDCFTLDHSELNPTPPGLWPKIRAILLQHRYSMTVFMRLTQYAYLKKRDSRNRFQRGLLNLLNKTCRRINQIANQFEHSDYPKIAPGIVFHHPGVCITHATVIESGVHLYRNVTFGQKNGKAPHIMKNAAIGSHSVVLGDIVVGEQALVAPGAVVVQDVPDRKIAAGVPARIIGDVKLRNGVPVT